MPRSIRPPSTPPPSAAALADLRSALETLARRRDPRWSERLEPRKQQEMEFHDRDRDVELTKSLDEKGFQHLHSNKKFYSTVEKSQNYMNEWIRTHAKDRVFLDYACGNGEYAIEAAKAGAALAIGIDISPVSIENCQRAAKEAGVAHNTFFVQADCENTEFPSESVDAVLCSGMLHHLDLSFAFPELRRVLKPGGVVLAMEALNYNPAIKLYRMLTPNLRTEWEKRHILSLKDVEFAKRFFNVRDVRYWHLASVLTTPLRGTGAHPGALKAANAVDEFLLRVPLVSLMAWMFSFEMAKPPEA